MQRRDKRAEFAFWNILKFINKQDHCRAALGGGAAHNVEKIDEVGIEIAIVSYPDIAKINRRFELAIAQLERLHEAREGAKALLCNRQRSLPSIKFEQRGAKGRHEDRRESLTFRGFDWNTVQACAFRCAAHFVQQYGLADAAQADKYIALGVTSGSDTI